MVNEPPNAVHPLSRAEWRDWLMRHHQRPEGVWLISFKKAIGRPYVEYDEAVEEALCFGWIDSRGNRLDAERSMLWFAPRKPGSGWSRLNKERLERLQAAGQLMPAGLAKIEAAQRDGSWSMLDVVETLALPVDLVTALATYPAATAHFEDLPRSVRRAILEWINAAKRTETRARRVEETARLAAENRRANQWRSPADKSD
jgi:uncharacterized protein YdeI (YjbR/CyaY-like superfamily)